MEEMNKNEVLSETEETVETVEIAETVEVKTYVVNCKTCGAALRVKDGVGAYMCPVCNKLFTLRKSEKLVKEVSEEEKEQFLKLQAMSSEAWEETEAEEKLPETPNDDKVIWEETKAEETSVVEEADDWNVEDVADEELPVEEEDVQDDWNIEDAEEDEEFVEEEADEPQDDWNIEDIEEEEEELPVEEEIQDEWNEDEASETEEDQGWIEVLDDAPMSKAEKKAIKAQAKAEKKAAAAAVKAEKKAQKEAAKAEKKAKAEEAKAAKKAKKENK